MNHWAARSRGATALLGAVLPLLLASRAGAVRPPLPPGGTFVPIDNKFPDPATACTAPPSSTLDVPSAAYPTIAAAVRAAPAGALVRVAAGVFTEDGNDGDLWYALKLAKDNTCLAGAGAGVTRIIAGRGLPPATVQKYGLLIEASNITVTGLSLEGFEALITLGRPGLKAQSNVVLRDLILTAAPGAAFTGGVIATPDHRKRKSVPVLDGLALSNVAISGVLQGVSCNFEPCAHWWLDRVTVDGRDPGDGGSGADAFAVENGRQIVITNSAFGGAGADGIDVKGSEVVVWRSSVRGVARNGIKLWQGGDVVDCVVNGTGADAALVGDAPGRFRYLRTTVTHHNPGLTSYVGVWGYGSRQAVDLEVRDCSFRGNALGGGLYVSNARKTRPRLVGNVFADAGTKLLEFGPVTLMTSPEGLAELERRGWGWNNTLTAV